MAAKGSTYVMTEEQKEAIRQAQKRICTFTYNLSKDK
ncbi:hypothetical protein ES704_01381 [subsurface metagenome]|jgi:hypothetical protein